MLTGWTPWGPLAQPNAYFPYDGEAERTKEWAIHCHASQVLLTDYTQYCSHLGRAYAALVREWAEGHSLAGRAHRTEERFVGVELFQIDTYDARKAKGFPADPIQIALGILSGQLAPEAPNLLDPASNASVRITHQDPGRRPDLTKRSRILALMYVPARHYCGDESLRRPRRRHRLPRGRQAADEGDRTRGNRVAAGRCWAWRPVRRPRRSTPTWSNGTARVRSRSGT